MPKLAGYRQREVIMKKLILFVSILLGLLLFPAKASADSPITSTGFYVAYQDIEVVKEAGEKGIMDSSIAAYLNSKDNPIDVKAAVINALSWSADGKSNADKYCRLIYKKSLKKVNAEALRGDQQFCIGYLMEMDDYYHTEKALKYLKMAQKKMPGSFTVSMISALTEAQDNMDDGWGYVQSVLQNNNLQKDMRQNAINIILNYMALYSKSKNIVLSRNNVLAANEGSQIIYLYGTPYVDKDESPYQLVQCSDIAAAILSRDKYGVFYVKITGVKNGTSSIRVKNREGKSAIINFDVISKEVYSRISNAVCMFIGSTKTYTGTSKCVITKKETPYLKSGKQYVPVEFIFKAFGGKVIHCKNGVLDITCKGKTIIIKAGSNTVSINGIKKNLRTKTEIKSGKMFITALDFTALMDQKYVYQNGLIFLAGKNVKMSTVTEDYFIDEIKERICDGKSVEEYLVPFESNDHYGYKDLAGNTVVEPIYESAGPFSEGMAAVSITNSGGEVKYGYIDASGDYVIKPVYDWARTFHNGLAPVFIGSASVFIDKEGNIAIESDYSGVGCFSSGLAPVLNAEKTRWGYTDTDGNLVIPYIYSDCGIFTEGLAPVLIGEKWGYIDRMGKIVIQPIYDQAWDFSDGIASVKLDGTEYSINKSGKTVAFYDSGDIYVGEQKDGMLQGTGTYTWVDGTQYSGGFSGGKLNGKGVYSAPDGSVNEGYWKDGSYVGETQ